MGRGMGRQAIQPNQQAFGLQTPQMPTSPGPGSPQTPQPIGGKGGMPPMHFGPQTPSQPGVSPGNFPSAQPAVLAPSYSIFPNPNMAPPAQMQYTNFGPQTPNMTPPPQMQPGLPGLLGMQSPDQMPPMQAQPLPFDPQRQQQLMQLAMQKQASMQDPMTPRGLGDAQYQERLNFVRQQLDNRGIPSNFGYQELNPQQLVQPNDLRQQMLGQQGMGQQAALKQQMLGQPVQTEQYTSPALQQTMRRPRRSRTRV